MNILTGYGYIKKDNKIISKYELPIGNHNFSNDYEVIEVESKEALDLIEVPAQPLTDEQQKEILIQQEQRKIAIANLKTKGILDASENIVK